MSYFKKPANPMVKPHNRVLSQSFYKNSNSNDYRFSTNLRTSPDPNKSFVASDAFPCNPLIRPTRTQGPEDNSILTQGSFNTMKKSHPMQQMDHKSLERLGKCPTDLRKFHDILEEKNEQVQEWMSRYLSLEQKLDTDLQQYKEEFYYQTQIQFRKKQDELNAYKLNLKSEITIIQEELNSSVQRLQLIEAENRQLLQQLKNQQAFTNTQLYKDMESNDRQTMYIYEYNIKRVKNDKHEAESQGQLIKNLKAQLDSSKRQNEYKQDDQDVRIYVQQNDVLKNQLVQEKVQFTEMMSNLKQEAIDAKQREKSLQANLNELSEQLKKKQDTIDKLKKNSDEEIEELQSNYEQRKTRDMQAICKLMQDKKDLNQELEQKKSLNQDLQNQIDVLSNELHNLKERYLRNQSYDDHDEQLKGIQKNFEDRFNSMQDYYDKLKKDNEDELLRLGEDYQKHINSLKHQLDTLRKQFTESQQEIYQLEQQSDSNEKVMINELSQLKIINRDLTDQFEHYEKQLSTLYAQIEDRDTQILQLRRSADQGLNEEIQ